MKNKVFEFLIAFIIAGMFLSIASLFNLYKSKKQYDDFMNILYEIENTNLKINFTIFGEKKIYSFDEINNEINLIKKNIEKLKKLNLYNTYKTKIELMEDKFNKKTKLVERFNSYNAINTSTIIYLLDISKILKEKTKSDMIDEAIFEIFKIYLGIVNENKKFSTNDKYLKPYFEYVNSVVEKLNKINKIKEKIKKISFDNSVEEIFNEFKQINIQVTKKLNNYIYFIGIVDILLLILLAFFHIKIFIFRKKLYQFKIAVDKSNNSVLFLNKKGFIYYVNESFEKNSGYKKEELINKHLSYYLKKALGEDNNEYKEILKSLKNDRKFSKILTLKNKNNEILYEKVLLYPVYFEGEFSNYVFLKLNITKEIQREKEIEYIAYHDFFTRLFNRKKLVEDLKKLIEKKEDFYLILLDINKFKYINDAFSHSMGDRILLSIADILRSSNSKYVYRTTGDEFALIVFGDYKKIAKNILEQCKKIKIDEQIFKIDISMGVVHSKYRSLNEILKFADIALNESKKTQKNLILFDDELYKRYMRETQIATFLPKAIDDNEFYVVYQPKIDIKTNKVYSLEALVRWKKPDLGEIYPNEFIPIAEERNYIEKIDEFVIKQACKDIKDLLKIYPYLKNISVNLSGIELAKEDLDKKIINLLKKENTNPEYIDFEVTETYLILNIENSATILKNLKKYGSKISIDDFGTGYSSLYYLSSLPFDTIKIDKKFIDNITDINNKELIKVIVSLAKTFGLNVVAEGVETEEQQKILNELGVYKIQGYLYSKPLQKEQLIEFLKNF